MNRAKQIISVLLIACLLTSNGAPAFAQVRPIGRGIQAGIKSRSFTHIPQNAFRVQVPYTPATTISPAVLRSGVTFTGLSLEQAVSKQVSLQQIQRPIAVANRLRAQIRQGQWNGVADAIFRLPKSHLFREDLLRNEFVTAALAGQASQAQINQAIQFYRADLAQRSSLLADIKTRSAADFLSQTPAETLKVYQEIVSSAGALAALGNKEDAAILVDFWQKAQGGPLEEVATNITGRGLLRFGAYADFNIWANSILPQGEVWVGFDAYLAKHDEIPVAIAVLDPHRISSLPREQMRTWLGEGCAVNSMNAYLSPDGTAYWMDLGKDSFLLSYVISSLPAAPKRLTPRVIGQGMSLSDPTVPLPVPTLQNPLPDLIVNPQLDFELTPLQLPKSAVETGSLLAPQQAVRSDNPRGPMDTSGILYGGIPFFAWGKIFTRWANRARSRYILPRRTAGVEDPLLHENTVKGVLRSNFDAPSEVTGADDLIGVEQGEPVLVAEDGFKLTIEEDDGTEQILHNVDVGIDAAIKTSGYNRLVLSNGHIFQMRNLSQPPSNLDHFYFELPNANGELWNLLRGQLNGTAPGHLLRIKLERLPNRRYQAVSLPARLENITEPVEAIFEVEAGLLPKDGQGELLIHQNGEISFVPLNGPKALLTNYYVRLPKEESRYWSRLMQSNTQTPFSLQIHPTKEKTRLLTMGVPLLQIGLGKTLAPELKSRTTLGESTSSTIMLGINNVLPVMMGFVHPLLRRYGEAAVLRWGTGLFVAGGAVALGSGLYGFLGNGTMNPWQLGGFITSSVLIALGTNVTRFVQNLLISANRGKIVPKDSFEAPKPAKETQETPVYNAQYLGHRFRQVFTEKPTTSARDVVLFQTAQMFKNLGTMSFLAAPWLVNSAAGLFGAHLELDFSASYVPYSLFGAWTAYRLSRSAYKDAIPTNLHAVENNFQETLSRVVMDLSQSPRQSLRNGEEDIMQAAKELKNAIDMLTRVESRVKKMSFEKLAVEHEQECIEALRKQLMLQGRSSTNVQNATQALQSAFDSLGHRDVRLGQVLLAPKVLPATLGMTLATMHELSVSNGFAFAMHNLLPDGAQANALTALVLYGSLSTGRLLGNWISRRISGGSMYVLSSAFSLAGTATMVAAGGHVPTLMTGAVIASFGVGNFFAQMYEYMTGLYPKFRREISLLINYTMPAAALMAMPMRRLVGLSGFAGMDLLVSGVGLLGSLALTSGMFANSSIVLAGKHGLHQLKQWAQGVFHRGKNPPPPDLGNAAPAQ